MIDNSQIAPKTRAGFTLVELMVVMAVLITLIGLSFAAYSLVSSDDNIEAQTEMRLIMQALKKYAEDNGGRYPPNVVPVGVEIRPENEDDTGQDEDGEDVENLKRDRASIAALFYFLTRHFVFEPTTYNPDTGEAEEADPQVIGNPSMTGKGPYLKLSIFSDNQFGLASVGRDEDIDVTLPEPGYTGETTWLLDPWGTPYRYVLKDNGRRYILESAGPDRRFGATLKQLEEYESQEKEKEEDDKNKTLTEEEQKEKDKEELKGPFEYSQLTETQREQMLDNIRSYDLE